MNNVQRAELNAVCHTSRQIINNVGAVGHIRLRARAIWVFDLGITEQSALNIRPLPPSGGNGNRRRVTRTRGRAVGVYERREGATSRILRFIFYLGSRISIILLLLLYMPADRIFWCVPPKFDWFRAHRVGT